MHFDYREEHELLRDAARGYLERNDPIARYRTPAAFDRDARRGDWRNEAAQGWTAMLTPEAYGGFGVSVVEAMVVAEELGRAGHAGAFAASNAVTWAISNFGSETQRQTLLPGLAAGELIIAWAAHQPGAPWGAAPSTVAEADAEGLRLSGEARFVQDADIADKILIAIQTPHGPAQALLPADGAGVHIRRAETIDVGRSHCEVTLENVRVAADDLLVGDPAAGTDMAEPLRIATLLTAADSVGAASRLLDMTVAYAKERVAFGKPIAAFQAIKHRCADMLILVDSARVAVWYAAVALRDQLPDAAEAVAIAKFYATESASTVAGHALQLHGGIGFTWEHDLHLFLKRAKANEMLWGANAWHRAQVAKGLAL